MKLKSISVNCLIFISVKMPPPHAAFIFPVCFLSVLSGQFYFSGVFFASFEWIVCHLSTTTLLPANGLVPGIFFARSAFRIFGNI